MKEIKLLNCPFCGENIIYKTNREDEFEIIIPQLFCNSCKMIFEIENDSPYMHDGKTYEYLEEKLYKTWNARVPMERIMKQLEERKETCNGHKCEKDGCAGCVDCKIESSYAEAIEIVKEEGV